MAEKIITYKELCISENVKSIQKGMNYRLNQRYSVILMSQKKNSLYKDKLSDGENIIYVGHNIPSQTKGVVPEKVDQPYLTKNGKFTENGKFALAAYHYKLGIREAENVKVYEKLYNGVWIDRGLYILFDFSYELDVCRRIFKFYLKPFKNVKINKKLNLKTRYIPSEIKKIVWKRDKGKCSICGSKINIHFDHILPYSKGGSSISEENIRLLCAKCNYKKSNRIE